MSDRKRLIKMLKKAKIPYEIGKWDEVILTVKYGTNVTGYTGFFAEFYFKDNGSLMQVSVWE